MAMGNANEKVSPEWGEGDGVRRTISSSNSSHGSSRQSDRKSLSSVSSSSLSSSSSSSSRGPDGKGGRRKLPIRNSDLLGEHKDIVRCLTVVDANRFGRG